MRKLNWRAIPSRVLWVLKLEIKSWVTSGCGVSYAVRKWFAVATDSRKILFLGSNFFYIDRLNPFSIFTYVEEVQKVISLYKLSDDSSSLRILEIGGNIGNWGVPLSISLPKAKLFTFEPNLEPYRCLAKNAARFDNWKIFNYGVGKESEFVDFFYIPEKSGQGSIYKENAGRNLLSSFDVAKTKVELKKLSFDFLSQELGGNYFDFVKIDVEGAEWDVIEGIRDVVWRGMYVELSLNDLGRESIEIFINKCDQIWGEVSVVRIDMRGKEMADIFLMRPNIK